jgi:hypothetical protein
MDLNIRLIHSRDFIRTTPEGDLDLAMSKEIILRLAVENARPGQYDILIDIRGTTKRLSHFDVANLVQVMIDHRESFRSRLAILIEPGERFDDAKFMELYAGNRGFQIGAFNDFEEAMGWLVTSSELTSEEGIS